MIDIEELQGRIVAGLHPYLQPYGVTAVMELNQDAPKPKYPFVGFTWATIIPEIGMNRRTREVVPSLDPRWEYDIEYRYVRSPRATLSVTAFDRDGTRVHHVVQRAHEWFSIPELASDWLAPYDASVVSTMAINNRDTVLDREIERRYGFDVWIRIVDVVRVRVPTIERVELTGMGGEIVQYIDL